MEFLNYKFYETKRRNFKFRLVSFRSTTAELLGRHLTPSPKPIRLPIRLNECEFAFFAGFGIAVFHATYTFEALVVQPFEDVEVVDFTRAGLLAAGIVADLDIGDFVPAGLHHVDEVAFIALHVEEVVKDFAGWT